MVYLALKIALSRPGNTNEGYRSMTFIQAALFQWLNPKGWSMALAAVSPLQPECQLAAVVADLCNICLGQCPVCQYLDPYRQTVESLADGAQLRPWF